MRRLIIIFIICALYNQKLCAQQLTPHADSLKRLVAAALPKHYNKPDTLTIEQLNKLASVYYQINPDSTLYYGQLAVSLSKKINYQKGIADGTFQTANVNTFRAKYAKAASNYYSALTIYLRLNRYKETGNCYDGLGRIQDFLGNYDQAIYLYKKALFYFLKTPDDADEGECYNSMGITYDSKGEFSKALDSYFKSLLINIRHNEGNAVATKYSNIGVVMQELELYNKALWYYERALAIWEKNGDQQGISTANENIGDLYIVQKDYNRAKPYIDRAYAIFKRMNDTEGLALVYYDIGIYAYAMKHPDSADYYLHKSLNLADKNKLVYAKAYALIGLSKLYNWQKKYQQAYINAAQVKKMALQLNSLIIETDASEQLSSALAGLRRFEEAYREHVTFADLRSNLKHNESIHKAIFYNLEIDFIKKQRDLADNQRKKEVAYQKRIDNQNDENLVAIAVIVVLAIIIFVYYKVKRKQQNIIELLGEKNREITEQQQSLNLQADKLNNLNILKDRLIGVLAHDLRAPISTLRGLFSLMTDENLSGEEFAAMTPKVFNKLENTSDFLDTLLFWINSQVDGRNNQMVNFSISDIVNRELQHLEDKLQYKNLVVHQDISPDVIAFADPNSVRIVIHNFLTNAIKFSNHGSSIKVSAWLENGEVNFCLKDQGVGMSPEYLNNLFKSHVASATGTDNEVGTGMGLLFCKDLIENQHGQIWAKSTLGSGSELYFTLPSGSIG